MLAVFVDDLIQMPPYLPVLAVFLSHQLRPISLHFLALYCLFGTYLFIYLFILIFLVVLGFEVRASQQVLYHFSHSIQPFFVLDILEVGTGELFARGNLAP
jgi:hypothetical protein